MDIEAGKLLAATLDGEETIWSFSERLGSFGLTTVTDTVVLALETGFALYDLDTRKLDRIEMPFKLSDRVRFNDGKCDPHGNFWAGTMSEKTPRAAEGGLYCLGSDRGVRLMKDGIAVSNGLAWSIDGNRMYFADSPTKTVFVYPASPEITPLDEGRPHVLPAAFKGVPDGSTVDADDRLWIAEWDGWRLQVRDGEGGLCEQIPLPVQRPTSCCFGGPDFETLFVTTASVDLSPEALAAQPQAGMVLVLDGLGKGNPAARFNLT